MKTGLSLPVLETARLKDIEGIAFGTLADLEGEQGNIDLFNLSDLFTANGPMNVNQASLNAAQSFESIDILMETVKANSTPIMP
jgi:hypothetical protein